MRSYLKKKKLNRKSNTFLKSLRLNDFHVTSISVYVLVCVQMPHGACGVVSPLLCEFLQGPQTVRLGSKGPYLWPGNNSLSKPLTTLLAQHVDGAGGWF